MKDGIKEYFIFSKSQSRGMIVLSILSLLAIAIYFGLESFISPPKPQPINDAEIEKMLASIYVDTTFYKNDNTPSKITPFNFNPNTLSEAGFIKLGLKPRLAKTILNYRNKGGTFYKKEDFKKIWGLHEQEYAQLSSYITIPKSENKFSYEKEKSVEKNLNIEINAATVEQLIELSGIAEKLGANIVNERKKLGGFYSVNQLKEVYGIRPETFDRIKKHLKCNPTLIKKININEATLQEMKEHPYLRKNDWALAITQFRKAQDYEIKALDDLKKIDGMTSEVFEKISPYLSLK